MKITILLSLISAAVVALSQPAWAGSGFHGDFGGGFRGGGSGARGFRGGALAAQHVGGGAMSRGGGVGFGSPRFGGVRSAPYMYGGTHFAGRSLGGSTGAFRHYAGGNRTSAARTYQFSGRGNQSMKSYAGQERNRCSPAESPGITNKAKHEDLERAVVGSGPEGDGQSPGVCAP